MRAQFIAILLILSTAVAHETGEIQEDGGVPGDAPNTCQDVDPQRRLVVDGESTQGILVPELDESDVYAASLGDEHVGHRMLLDFDGVPYDPYELSFDILTPDCSESVFAEDASIYDTDPSRIPPEEPVPALPGAKTLVYEGADLANAHQDSDTVWRCQEDRWKVKFSASEKIAWPATIYVEWSDGSHAYVPVDSTGGFQAQYKHDFDLGFTLARVVASVPETSDASIEWIHGPCDAAVGEPQVVAEPPRKYDSGGEFTVVQPGEYVLVVTVSAGPAEKAEDDASDLISSPPTTIPVSCHRECPFFDSISYQAILSDMSGGN